MNSNNELKEFYLDIARYTFDYLFENRETSFVIKLSSNKERRRFKAIMDNAFIFVESNETSCVLIYVDKVGICARYVEGSEGESYDDFVNMLYRFADREDSTLTHVTTKRLFTESLRNGFKYIDSIR